MFMQIRLLFGKETGNDIVSNKKTFFLYRLCMHLGPTEKGTVEVVRAESLTEMKKYGV